jgi:hypothetical protein
MNTINKQTDTLTRLIAEIVELDSNKQCLAVELDYLIKHVQVYKQTCEDAKHRVEFPDHKICECDCCIDCGCCECEKEEEGSTCAECGISTAGRKIRGLWDNVLCEECGEHSDDEESEDGDWDGDLDYTPNCHECGEDCGRTIVSHHKYKNTYFCGQKCLRKYDGEQDDFTSRMCENPECKKEFDLADPHYYDEDQGVCYCCEECSTV